VNERLATSASPYLRAHATNPVAWFPWGDEAFAEARRRDVPVFVSIGYSTCHWCHVMARESFSDPQIAAELAAGFVSIKVDREEHPEVDEAYLAAAAAFTRSLGWPLSVFATPDGRAFFAGTYFPPEPRSGMPSFLQVLAAVRQAWTDRRAVVDASASAVVDALREAGAGAVSDLPTVVDLAEAAHRAAAFEDPDFGGFTGPGADATTPKFPMAPALGFLLAADRDTAPGITQGSNSCDAADRARNLRQIGVDSATSHEIAAPSGGAAVVGRALEAMAASPLRDDVDGGFFRYATRRDWSEPHYERMLTDNAVLLDVALDAGRIDLARGTAAFLIDVLQRPTGGFAAAQDSESWIDGRRSEGGYYRVDAASRAQLEPPAIDGKVVTGWNGLAIGALARAGARLGDDSLIEAARRAAGVILASNVDADGRLLRASLDEMPSRAAGTAEDAGLLAAGLCALTAATGEAAPAVAARELLAPHLAGANDAPKTSRWADPVLQAQRMPHPPDASDSDHPTGASALALGALALWLLGAGDDYRAAATDIVRAHVAPALADPLAHGSMLQAALLLARGPRHVVVVTGDADSELVAAARHLPCDVLAIVTEAQAAALADAGFSVFDGKAPVGGMPAAYDCRDFTCRLPVTDPADLR
jgi:uncharacterized protein YyaL (SSP411 family)